MAWQMEQLLLPLNPLPPPSLHHAPDSRSHSPLYERLYSNGIAGLKKRDALTKTLDPELTFHPKTTAAESNGQINNHTNTHQRLYEQGTKSLKARIAMFKNRPLPKGVTFNPSTKRSKTNMKPPNPASQVRRSNPPDFGNRLYQNGREGKKLRRKKNMASQHQECTFRPQINRCTLGHNTTTTTTTANQSNIFNRLYNHGRKTKDQNNEQPPKLDATKKGTSVKHIKKITDRLHAQSAERQQKRMKQQQLAIAEINKRCHPDSFTKTKRKHTSKSVVGAFMQQPPMRPSPETSTPTPTPTQAPETPTPPKPRPPKQKAKYRPLLHLDKNAQKMKQNRYQKLYTENIKKACTFKPKVNANAKRSPGSFSNAGDRLHQRAQERQEKRHQHEIEMKKKIKLPKKPRTLNGSNDALYQRAMLIREQKDLVAKEIERKKQEDKQSKHVSRSKADSLAYSNDLYQRGKERLQRKDQKTIQRYQNDTALTLPSQIEIPPSFRKMGRKLSGTSPRHYLPGGKTFSPPKTIADPPGIEECLIPRETLEKIDETEEQVIADRSREKEEVEVERRERQKRMDAYQKRNRRTVQTQMLDIKLAKRQKWLDQVHVDERENVVVGWDTSTSETTTDAD